MREMDVAVSKINDLFVDKNGDFLRKKLRELRPPWSSLSLFPRLLGRGKEAQKLEEKLPALLEIFVALS